MKHKTITTHYGIDYGKPFKSSPKAGWYVYAESDGKPIRLHHVHDTEEAAIEEAHQEQAARDRRAASKAETAPAKAQPATTPAAPAVRETSSEQLATPRQVDYIMSLIAQGRHEEGGFHNGPTTREGVEQMTKQAASVYITSLKSDY
jgi:pyruvate/2-oxoglutarate dehydrogenase complex dihydrolipoamide acyltransferase (E2) component